MLKNIDEIDLDLPDKYFDLLVLKTDVLYNDIVKASKIVKDFIIDHNYIIYGGTAIDMALRLKGSKIYPDEIIDTPDLDFYTPNAVDDAYDLAEIFYAKGYSSARAISALHIGSLKVDIENNHFVADLSYVPKSIFDKMPTLQYNGMRIIHPTYQRIDIHTSLCYPYVDAPRETIFHRWKKDINRFNLLDEHYPITSSVIVDINSSSPAADINSSSPAADINSSSLAADINSSSSAVDINSVANINSSSSNNNTVKKKRHIPRKYFRYLWCGDVAYALIFLQYTQLCVKLGVQPLNVISLKCSLEKDYFEYESVLDTHDINIINHKVPELLKELNMKKSVAYNKYFNMIPAYVESIANSTIVYEMPLKLIGYKSYLIVDKSYLIVDKLYDMGEVKLRIVNIHFVMIQYLSHFIRNNDNISISMYKSLLTMITHVTELVKDLPNRDELISTLMFFPSINTYGAENLSTANIVQNNRILSAIGIAKQLELPRTYSPRLFLESNKPRPIFDYKVNKFFIFDGSKIEA